MARERAAGAARTREQELSLSATLADFTCPGLIIPALRGCQAAEVIAELSQALCRQGCIPDPLAFCEAVMKRESLATTELEAGMAFPHARLPELKALSFALGRSSEPLPWSAGAARSVRLVFLLAVPADDSGQYLRLISGLARLTRERQFLEDIHAAPDAIHLFEALHRI